MKDIVSHPNDIWITSKFSPGIPSWIQYDKCQKIFAFGSNVKNIF